MKCDALEFCCHYVDVDDDDNDDTGSVFRCVNEKHSSTDATSIVTSFTTNTIKLMTMNFAIILQLKRVYDM